MANQKAQRMKKDFGGHVQKPGLLRSEHMPQRQALSRCGQVNKKTRERARQGQGPRRRARHAKGGPAISLRCAFPVFSYWARNMRPSHRKKKDKKVCQEIVSVNPYFYISSDASSKPLAQRKKKPVLPLKIIHEKKR